MSPLARRRISRRSKSSNKIKNNKKEKKEKNPTGCKYCDKYGGNGNSHAPPKSIPHSKCNYNKKYKGWRPEWVCNKLGIDYKEYDDCSE